MLQLPKASMLTLKETSGIKNADDSTIITLKILLPNFPFGTPNPQTVTIHCHICLFFFFFPQSFFPQRKKKITTTSHHCSNLFQFKRPSQQTRHLNSRLMSILKEKSRPGKGFTQKKEQKCIFSKITETLMWLFHNICDVFI